MNLKAKIHVDRQKAAAEESLNARVALLKERGLEGDRIKRDPRLRQIKARITKANDRLAAIAAQEKLNQERAQAKLDKPPKDKAAKKARKAEVESAESGKKAKKAKKENAAN